MTYSEGGRKTSVGRPYRLKRGLAPSEVGLALWGLGVKVWSLGCFLRVMAPSLNLSTVFGALLSAVQTALLLTCSLEHLLPGSCFLPSHQTSAMVVVDAVLMPAPSKASLLPANTVSRHRFHVCNLWLPIFFARVLLSMSALHSFAPDGTHAYLPPDLTPLPCGSEKIQNKALAVGVRRNQMKGTEEGRRTGWGLVIGGRRANIQFLYVGIIGPKNFFKSWKEAFWKAGCKDGK